MNLPTQNVENSDLLNFLNSPSENLLLVPPQTQSLFVLDPRLANLDRVKYQSQQSFTNRFHYKPNHIKCLEKISKEFSVQYMMVCTDINSILFALSHPTYALASESITRSSILSADVAHNVCVSNIGKYHLWSIMAYCHPIGRSLPIFQVLLPDLTIRSHCHIWQIFLQYHDVISVLTSDKSSRITIPTSQILCFDNALHYLNAKLTPSSLAELDRILLHGHSISPTTTLSQSDRPATNRIFSPEFRIARTVSYSVSSQNEISIVRLSLESNIALSALSGFLGDSQSLLGYVQLLDHHFVGNFLFANSERQFRFYHYNDMHHGGCLKPVKGPLMIPEKSSILAIFLNSPNPSAPLVNLCDFSFQFGLPWTRNSCWFDSICILLIALFQFFSLEQLSIPFAPLNIFLGLLSCQFFPEFKPLSFRTIKRQLTKLVPRFPEYLKMVTAQEMKSSCFPAGVKRLAIALRLFLLQHFNSDGLGTFGSAFQFFTQLSSPCFSQFSQSIVKICPYCQSPQSSTSILPECQGFVTNGHIALSKTFNEIEYFRCHNNSCLLSLTIPSFRIDHNSNIHVRSSSESEFLPLSTIHQSLSESLNTKSLVETKRVLMDIAKFSQHHLNLLDNQTQKTFLPSVSHGSYDIQFKFSVLVGDYDLANLKGFILGVAAFLTQSSIFPFVYDSPRRHFGLSFTELSIDLAIVLSRQVLAGCRFHLKQAFHRSSRVLPQDQRGLFISRMNELIMEKSKSGFFSSTYSIQKEFPALSSYLQYWSNNFFRLIAFKSFQSSPHGFSRNSYTTNMSESFHRQLRSLNTRNMPISYFFIILSKFLDHFELILNTPGVSYRYGTSYLTKTSRVKRPRSTPASDPQNRPLYPSETNEHE